LVRRRSPLRRNSLGIRSRRGIFYNRGHLPCLSLLAPASARMKSPPRSVAAGDQLDAELAQRGIELIAPHRRDRKRKTQDGRPLRRYRRRWKVERLFAWLQNYRRVVDALRASLRELSGNGAPRLLPPPAAAFMRRLLASSDPFLQTARVFPGAPQSAYQFPMTSTNPNIQSFKE